MFNILGWREGKAVFEVELQNSASLDCSDIHAISSLFNLSPNNDNCSGCQFVLSFVLYVGDECFYHPYLEDQDNYYIEMEFYSCHKDFFESEIIKDFNQKDWN